MRGQLRDKVIGPQWADTKPHDRYRHADGKDNQHQERHELEPHI